MFKKIPGTILPIVVIILLSMIVSGCWPVGKTTSNGVNLKHENLSEKDAPVHLGEFKVPDNKKPAWVYVYENNLYINYYQDEKIDICSLTGEKQGELRAKVAKDTGAPQGMLKTSRGLMVSDFENGAVGFFADNGRLLDAYYETAEKRQIKPVSAAVYGEVFYVTDVSINGWFTVFQDGEMIMEIKGDKEEKKLEFPYGIIVTSDGRVIVTDPVAGKVKVFNCAGWYAFDFPTEEVGLKNPQGIAMDDFGRFHIVDNGTGKVFVYDNLGRYMFSYGEGLVNPSTVTINLEHRVIYITNTEAGKISLWGY